MGTTTLPRNETLLAMPQARAYVKERAGRRIDLSTLWRWCVHGVKGVRLEHVRAGREIRTSAEAIDRFFSRLAGAYLQQPVEAVGVNLAHEQAERELKEAGL